MAKNKNKTPMSDPSANDTNDSTSSNTIDCSFYVPINKIKDVDTMKVNNLSGWGSSTLPDGRIQIKGSIDSDFDDKWPTIYADEELCMKLSRRSYNIDLQREKREEVKRYVGLIKETARITIATYNDKVALKLVKAGQFDTIEDAMAFLVS
jgi:hypothetical protein